MTTTDTDTASQLQLLPPAGGDRLVLTVTEAGQLLGISRAFAYELATRGELPVIRLGRRLLVPKRALLEMVGAATDGTWPASDAAGARVAGGPGSHTPGPAPSRPSVAS